MGGRNLDDLMEKVIPSRFHHPHPNTVIGKQLANFLVQLNLFGLAKKKCLWGICVLKC